ncbi:MAG TPA: UDP-glucose 4-epimerase GalE [Dongiaceae bacterium]|nr:UDP-glucose 4-epimerase GalE [Dongiaceae bacterium]
MTTDKKVLVTGGAGYVGSHACKALAKAGYAPIVYDNFVHGHHWAVRYGDLEYGDILDRARLDEVMAKHTPEAVLHFAAFAYVGESVGDPSKYYRTNVAGTENLLQAMRDYDVGKIVFSSSCAVYGNPERLPITEDMPKNPINPYGVSKLIVERMLVDFHAAHGLNWVALRYFNAAGCDPDGEIGEIHSPETHIIALALDVASGRRDKLIVFGTDYDTPDGSCIRDYVHVSDLADAHIKALHALDNGMESRAFNLGTGRGFSVLDIIASVERVTGRPVPYEVGARREGDPAILISDAHDARTILGWTPAITELDDIVRTAWRWHDRVNSGRRRVDRYRVGSV